MVAESSGLCQGSGLLHLAAAYSKYQLWLVCLPEDCSSPAGYAARPAQGSVCCAPLQGQYIPLFLRAQVRASSCGASSFALSDSQGVFKVISDKRHLKPLLPLKL